MADVPSSDKNPITIDSVNNFVVGGNANGGVSTLTAHLTANAFTGSITVKGRKRGTARAFVAIPYKSRYLNGAVAADASVTTAITGTSIIEVNSAGLDISFDCTAVSGGNVAVDYDWNLG